MRKNPGAMGALLAAAFVLDLGLGLEPAEGQR